MKYLLLTTSIGALLFTGSFAQSQSSGARCGETTPRFCVGEPVRYAGKDQPVLGVSQGLSTYLLKNHYNDDVQVGADLIGKKSGRGETDPNFRAEEQVRYAGKTQKILGIQNNGKQYILKNHFGDDAYVAAESIGKQSGRGKTNPSFSFGEIVRYAGSEQMVLGIINNTVYILKNHFKDDVRVSAESIGKIRNKDTTSIDNISIYLSPDTQDLFESYATLAKVTTKERSAFLKTLSAQVKGLIAVT